MKAYKAFNKDMTCRGFQFKEGETYTEPEAKLCKKGFHACLNPFDCWNYYDPFDSEIHEVELEDVSDERNKEDTKVVAKQIKIGAKLDLKGIINASISFFNGEMKNVCDTSSRAMQTGDSSQAMQTGDSSRAMQIGDFSKAEMKGKFGIICSVGRNSMAKGCIGTWITLASYNTNNEPLCVKSFKIDGDTYKADTWYKLEGENIIEC